LTAPADLVADRPPHRQLDPGRTGVDGLQVALFLVVEVVVEGLSVQPHLGDRILNRGLLVPLRANCFEHPSENALTLSGQSPRPVELD